MKNIRVKPRLSLVQIVNMSMGFLGIQMGFALQNGNASRILQTFGADVEHLSLFWLAAPLTGMLVQPIIGHYSDRTWTKMGRRRPFFLAGAVLTAVALVLMPNIAMFTAILPPLLIGAGMLMLMDASINVTMEPFRALIGDNLASAQRSLGFSVQTVLIGIGAVIGSWLPYLLAEYLPISAEGGAGIVPQNVIYSFYAGAIVLIATILWTVFTTREYSPQELGSFTEAGEEEPKIPAKQSLMVIFHDFRRMPLTMKKLGWVQFFSWFALFMMWVYTTPAVAEHVFYKMEGERPQLFEEAANWVGVLFGVYNGVSAIYALLLPKLARRFGRTNVHAFGLTVGGLSLISMFFISSPNVLLLTMLGIGIAWGSILSMPYAILSDSLPAHKMGVYMGIFNFFITFPQIVCGFFGGMIIKYLFGSEPIYGILLGGIFMLLGAISVWRIKE
ncbi:maltose/moltooligosaccharide transporter [Sphingobacterium allocomposti]|uniref:Maltose/moltooligosaccharide transporter n=1 Tax=Sphingobacterium allocomposti TaxID=415956 RepID=A0A5S5DQ28_9SPHI|nr:MFS transporter [Sphingobacterium composti Yoo et al. 2007 non Ten et al. 2007]TYP97825.1 maltose/moltooligosaccharide transporter [Sphingobacterium composti Yoo et al. 2007 non Ten et al. 2007]